MSDNKLNLILHCGGQEVSYDDVVNAETPAATDTWHPITHESLIERVVKGMEQSGMIVKNSVHGLWKDGLRYFGLMEVVSGDENDDYGLVIGLRNSHDKSFPASLALGSGVFVCDNLAFSGEVKLARRHTKNIERDLPSVVLKAISRLGNLRHTQERRIEAYKETNLTDLQAHDFIIRALEQNVIGSQRVKPVVEQWRKPNHDEFLPRNAWSLFNDFTEVLKPKQRQGDRDNNNLHALPAATQKLHGLMDIQCGINLDVKKDEILG
jgi:hypothetical protein